MTRYLMDTGIASDYINKRNSVFERADSEMLKGNPVGIAITVLAELVHGIENSQTKERNRKLLSSMISSLRIWPFDNLAAHECGYLRAEMESRGSWIHFADATIAAIALTLGNTVVVTKDSDFRDVPGLKTENWAV